ncbi:hypothetical protein HanIR_Chr11g0535331 [Helianthus annuus]|nr:hypothetical protein HanIR_Chr11g0535331 [Helianthus annuus]
MHKRVKFDKKVTSRRLESLKIYLCWMLDFNSIRWRIKLRTRRKKNRVKQINNEEVMAVFVKSG